MIRAGQLREQVLLRTRSGTLDTYGERQGGTEFSYTGPFSAGVRPVGGGERVESAQVTPELSHEVTMRPGLGVVTGTGIVIDSTAPDIEVVLQAGEDVLRDLFSSRVLEVDSIQNVRERDAMLRIACTEGVRS